MGRIEKITKRNGKIVDFNPNKIIEVIFKAAQAVGGKDKNLAEQLAKEVEKLLEETYQNKIPSVENVQDLVEKILIEKGHAKTAKAYILYRYQKNEERKQRAFILGEKFSDTNIDFSRDALKILEKRYLLKDEEGNLCETPQEMVRRVAANISQADLFYGIDEEQRKESEEKFYQMLAELRFLPNSPTIINAGTTTQQLSSCFVLPIEDSMIGIFNTLKNAAIIHQRGSGTGFSFSKLRPRGDLVKKHLGVASGPIAFLKVYNAALDVIKQGGVRPGANMAVLRMDHPNIINFIEAKRSKLELKNFNISVAVTDKFMQAVQSNQKYCLINPRTKKKVEKLLARDVFSLITINAWKTGDPGLIFIDEINRRHPAKHLGLIETTNQCGEAPLLPYEGCVLGSINLKKFISDGIQDLNWGALKNTVKDAVHFLDNVIDMNTYPSKEIELYTKKTRKFGLGIMGLADIFFILGVKYDSEEGLVLAEKIMKLIKEAAYEKSSELAEERGTCPAWEGSEHQKAGRKMRNISCISIAPTGTISILANVSSGCEPIFALSYQRTVFGDNDLIYVNSIFEQTAKNRGFYSSEIIRKISQQGSIKNILEIPQDIRDVFVTSQDIKPEWHIRMQATLQEHVDNSISKTINFSKTTTIKEVEEAYFLAWKAKCKGITIYRDGSYQDQVISIGK